jgi:hypothetical protein
LANHHILYLLVGSSQFGMGFGINPPGFTKLIWVVFAGVSHKMPTSDFFGEHGHVELATNATNRTTK